MIHTTVYTTQTLTWSTAGITVKPKLTETEEITCGILSVYDSLNRLCETLGRLACVLQRKDIEVNLAQNSPKMPIIYNKGRIL